MPNPILIQHAGILTMDAGRRLFTDGAMLIENDRITRVGRTADLLPTIPPGTEIIDLTGKWVLPGFVNTHVHTSQQLGRGLGDDVPLLIWLRERIWPYESCLTGDDSYLSTLLCGLEQIRNGTTCFVEAGGQHVTSMAHAVTELGLRAALTKSTMDTGEGLPIAWQRTTRQELEAQVENFERLHGTASGRIRIWFGLRTIFNNTDELIKGTVMLAEKVPDRLHHARRGGARGGRIRHPDPRREHRAPPGEAGRAAAQPARRALRLAGRSRDRALRQTRREGLLQPRLRDARAGHGEDPRDDRRGGVRFAGHGRRALQQPHEHGGRDVGGGAAAEGAPAGSHRAARADRARNGNHQRRAGRALGGRDRLAGGGQEGGSDHHRPAHAQHAAAARPDR